MSPASVRCGSRFQEGQDAYGGRYLVPRSTLPLKVELRAHPSP